MGEGLQDPVTLVMAPGVVDGLETGEVEEQAGQVSGVLFQFGPALVEVAAVEAPGERIAEAQLLEPGFHLLARSNVAITVSTARMKNIAIATG